MGLFDFFGGKGAKPKAEGGDEGAEGEDKRASHAPPAPTHRAPPQAAREAEEDDDEEDERVARARAAQHDPRAMGIRVLLQSLETILTQIDARLEPMALLPQVQGMMQAVAITISKSDKVRDQLFAGLRAHLTQEVDRLGATLRLEASKQGALDVFKSLLPALDDVELILREAPEGEEARHLTSLRMVHRKLRDGLGRLGVEPVEVQERVTHFDAAVHEAEPYQGEPEAVAGLAAGTVVRVERSGYRVGDVLVRPARVVVVKG